MKDRNKVTCGEGLDPNKARYHGYLDDTSDVGQSAQYLAENHKDRAQYRRTWIRTAPWKGEKITNRMEENFQETRALERSLLTWDFDDDIPF